jgi:hypothetical protein
VAQLRTLERAQHSQVSDLLARLRTLLPQYAANQGDIESNLHKVNLNPNPAMRPSAIYLRI